MARLRITCAYLWMLWSHRKQRILRESALQAVDLLHRNELWRGAWILSPASASHIYLVERLQRLSIRACVRRDSGQHNGSAAINLHLRADIANQDNSSECSELPGMRCHHSFTCFLFPTRRPRSRICSVPAPEHPQDARDQVIEPRWWRPTKWTKSPP